ncbi:MAG: peptide-methionine (R)-S-oxide reductase MsrB [Gammaproteobacteria bacterium]|nr:peptide-methionine (R)-S-oxide reductase MsrB [Gammaproteobacteria bacterium]
MKNWIIVLLVSFGSYTAQTAAANRTAEAVSTATFAGGCFWCMEQPFEQLDGVSSVISGFAGGTIKNPSYRMVARGKTNHVEAVQISYDPTKITYQQLLTVYWRQIDPTDNAGSFVDRGKQYRPVIYFHSATQLDLAQHSIKILTEQGRFPKKIVVELTAFTTFYPAPDYHQNYYSENPLRYHYYRSRSGRDDYLDLIWGNTRDAKPQYPHHKVSNASRADLKQLLTTLQFDVTQNDATEPSFNNEYWDNKQQGIYVDIVSGEALFSSTDKFRSGTGWPSFTKAISKMALTKKQDNTLFTTRMELRSRVADSHLGHLFEDGPAPTGQRYCINSASLRFIPASQLKAQGYAQYGSLF